MRVSKIFFLIILCIIGVVLYVYMLRHISYNEEKIKSLRPYVTRDLHDQIVENFYKNHRSWETSNLGSILFKNEDMPRTSRQAQRFIILIWKYWDWLQNRHVYNFGSNKNDPLVGCSVRNCDFTGDDNLLNKADAVVVHLHRGLIPKVENRNPSQRWIFLNDESPLNAFALAQNPPELSELANIFNWSMTYRSDADVPVPYGRTIPLSKPLLSNTQYSSIAELVPNWKNKRRDVLAAILISNCAVTHRMNFLEELKKHIKVEVHGKCGDDELKDSCPGHFKSNCKPMSEYLFYLVLENSLCRQYITEKLFYHAYSKGAIPIIMGPSQDDCVDLLPPNSFLHVDNFETPGSLALEIKNISKDEKKLLSFHEWRNHFDAINEHGYFGSKSYHLCRLCEAMNYNDEKESVYNENDIRLFLDPKVSCKT